ncbi:FAD-dependent oxidoreductase, partial [Tsukamurella paurometabola]
MAQDWDATADVVVVGYGGAGAAAALAARESGADVLALDRYLGGGATNLSGGIVYAGGGTRIQRAAGIDDDAENMFSYLRL